MVSETLRAKKLEVIKKTTFNVYCRAYSYYSCGEEEVYDGWMDRSGYITLNRTHHHVEAALEILKELDRECKNRCTHYKEFLHSLDLAKKNPTDWLKTFVYNYCYYLKVYRDIINKINSIDDIAENVEMADKELSKAAIKPHYVNDFKKVNKNFGLDAGEFLVANLGYIAIEGKKAIYNCSKEIGTTIKQREKLHCYAENGILIDNDSAAAREKDANEERQWVIDNREYYSDWRNQFHCPSGTTRVGYARFISLARKHGIQTSTRRSMIFSSY